MDELAVPGHYRFAHALVREAVLAGLTATRRALLHRRMAEVLEALPDARRVAELARHLLDARPLVDAATAAGVALQAADEAIRRLAYEDAAELLDRAAEGDLDDPAARGGPAGARRRAPAAGRRAVRRPLLRRRRRPSRAPQETTSCWRARRSGPPG